MKYLSTVSKDHRLPSEIRTKLAEWATNIGKEKVFRDLVVHGVISLTHKQSLMWAFETLELHDGEPKLVYTEISDTAVLNHLSVANKLFRETALLVAALAHTSSARRR